MKGIVFLPDMRSISGAKSLSRELIEARDGRDLDQVLASAGTVQVLPKEALRPFLAARKAVETALLAKGTRFFGGYLVDEQIAPKVHAELEKIQQGYEQAKVDLLQALPSHIENRVKDAPEWEDVIRQNAPEPEEIQDNLTSSSP